ncbi:MAG TPA: ATP-binding cassette domain-containing protein, partial [Acidimicrobiales bacterium]|nr:ATP-binding cassette domain-containing protein [Acidimicrobiales bacterium]
MTDNPLNPHPVGPNPMGRNPIDVAPLPPESTLDVSHLEVSYRVRGKDRLALRDVSFQIGPQESFGLVGESGCGKSTTALAITRYLPRNGRQSGGSIIVNGRD